MARPEVIDIEQHKKRIKSSISKGIRSFYLLARGGNIELVKILARDIDNWENARRVDEIKSYKIRFNKRDIKAIYLKYIVLNFKENKNERVN